MAGRQNLASDPAVGSRITRQPPAPMAGATPIEPKLRPSEFRWEIYDVAHEASFEAKESRENRDGIGSRWGVVAGGWRIRCSRWSAGRCSEGEHGNYSR
jgi:hypothetical protein